MSKLLHKSHILPLLSGISLMVFTAISAYYIVFFHVSPLSRDQWHMYAPYFEHGLLYAALTPMSTHRHIFPFFLFDIDMSLFGGRNHFLIFAGAFFDSLIIMLLTIALKRDQMLSRLEKQAFFVLIISALVWLINIAQLGWGFMSAQYYLAILTYLLSIICAYRYCHSHNHLHKAHTHSTWLWSSIMCGVICTFSFGMGILVWPALLFFAWLWRSPVRVFVLILLSLIFCLALFLLLPGGESIENSLLFLPKYTITFLFQLAGGPIYYFLKSYRILDTEALKSIASNIGIVATATGILLLLRLLKTRPALSLFSTLCCALILVGLGTATLISFTRNPFFLDVWVDRYQIWATLFWLGFLPLCCTQFNQILAFKKYLRTPLLCGLFFFPLLALPSQLDMGARLSEYKIRVQQALLAYQVGISDKRSAEEALHWNWENKLTPFFIVLQHLKDQKKNIYYVDYTDMLGRPVSDLTINHSEPVISLQINKTDSIHQNDLLDLQKIPGAENFLRFNVPASIVAYQISATVVTSKPWTHALITNGSGKVIGLGIAINHSKLPRSHLKYINSDYNLFAIVRNDDVVKMHFYFLDGNNRDAAQMSDEISAKNESTQL